eukprot:CAMPEP_0119143778 /NCGR_PEP_ID=MMETSP1310-20130426/34838_1 /TAXON_ID=464262 /ORGANISM="Genus nov. species nov., Strain RCC2339" /LENGTH=60 /DNA_ID=CAMNT_0007135441 /DNA_START=44 /DNA_END=223 /DNA_ORIENTATION=+
MGQEDGCVGRHQNAHGVLGREGEEEGPPLASDEVGKCKVRCHRLIELVPQKGPPVHAEYD